MPNNETVTCEFCAKVLRSDNLYRHCKSKHLEIMIQSMNVEESRLRTSPVVIGKGRFKTSRLTAVCAVCSKGAQREEAIAFHKNHVQCNDMWDSVSWLFGVGKKPKAIPRGKYSANKSMILPTIHTIPAIPTSPAVPLVPLPDPRDMMAREFPAIFDCWDYDEGDESDEDEDADKITDRMRQRAMSLQDMCKYVATILAKAHTANAKKRPADCNNCKQIQTLLSEAEQKSYMLQQALDNSNKYNNTLENSNEAMQRELDALKPKGS